MLEYENFLLASFPVFEEHYGTLNSKTEIQKVKRRAIRFLEFRCSATWAFPAEAHIYDDPTASKVRMIPTSYDAGLLLPLLKDEGLDAATINAMISNQITSRMENGFWNFSIHEPDFDADVLPDDVDDTGVSMMALYIMGRVTEKECRELGAKMIDNALYDKNGVMGTWIGVKGDKVRKIIHEKYLQIPYVCAGCLTNGLWFLAAFNMETDPRVIPSVEYIGKWIDILYEGRDSDEELEGMTYYRNKYLIYFFIARFLVASSYAGTRFRGKLTSLVLYQLEALAGAECRGTTDAHKAMDIASLILAATTLKLHLEDAGSNGPPEGYTSAGVRQNILKLVNVLLRLQGSDGSFPARVIYRWNRLGHFGGSKPYSTGLVLAALGIVEREILGGSSSSGTTNGSG